MLRLQIMLMLIISLVMTCCGSNENSILIIAGASSTEFVMEELIQEFKRQTGVNCKLITGSSGKLSSQIKEQAPYDIFVSADMDYPIYLFDLGLTTEKPIHFANGRLVLWTLNDSLVPVIDVLESKQVKAIAISNPKHAPYGKAAFQSLNYYKKNNDTIIKKLIWPENVSQVNHFVYSGSTDIGFTSKSSVLSPKLRDKGKWTDIDPSSHQPIKQSLVIIRNTQNMAAANSFKEFIISEKAKAILHKFGYITF